jgi:hypothetical protein
MLDELMPLGSIAVLAIMAVAGASWLHFGR